MGWHYKPPQNFPKLFIEILKEAARFPNEAILFYSTRYSDDAKAVAEKFRWFRWCIRKDPDMRKELTDILNEYMIRVSTVTDEVGILLYVTAKRSKEAEFLLLNPDLAATIIAECQ